MGKGYDMHVHTKKSDGKEIPEVVVGMALKKKLRGIAITDHDTIDGIAEATKAAEGTGLMIVPGVEVSADIICKKYSLQVESHLLFYFFDHNSEEIKSLFEGIKTRKFEYSLSLLDCLKRDGIMTEEEINQNFIEKIEQKSIRKDQIVKYLSKTKGVDESECRARIKKMGIPDKRICIEDALAVFASPVVIAHPGLIIDEYNHDHHDSSIDFKILKDMLKPYRHMIVGLEADYPYHKIGRLIAEDKEIPTDPELRKDIRNYASSRFYNEQTKILAGQMKVISVSGSDCHQKQKQSEVGECITPFYIFNMLKGKINRFRNEHRVF